MDKANRYRGDKVLIITTKIIIIIREDKLTKTDIVIPIIEVVVKDKTVEDHTILSI